MQIHPRLLLPWILPDIDRGGSCLFIDIYKTPSNDITNSIGMAGLCSTKLLLADEHEQGSSSDPFGADIPTFLEPPLERNSLSMLNVDQLWWTARAASWVLFATPDLTKDGLLTALTAEFGYKIHPSDQPCECQVNSFFLHRTFEASLRRTCIIPEGGIGPLSRGAAKLLLEKLQPMWGNPRKSTVHETIAYTCLRYIKDHNPRYICDIWQRFRTTSGELSGKDHLLSYAANHFDFHFRKADRTSGRISGLFHHVVEKAFVEATQQLGTGPPETQSYANMGLSLSAFYNFPVQAQVYVEMGAHVDRLDCTGFSPLHLASLCGNTAVVELLLSEKPTINLPHPGSGDTALHFAVSHGNFEVVALLLRGGIDVHARNHTGETAIDVALRQGEMKIHRLIREWKNQSKSCVVKQEEDPS